MAPEQPMEAGDETDEIYALKKTARISLPYSLDK